MTISAFAGRMSVARLAFASGQPLTMPSLPVATRYMATAMVDRKTIFLLRRTLNIITLPPEHTLA